MNTYKNIIYLLFILFLISSCSPQETIKNEMEDVSEETSDIISITDTQFEKSGFKIGQLEERAFNSVLSVTGKIHLPNKSRQTITSNVSGIVNHFGVIKGHWVKKGQRLFTLSNPELIDMQQQYLESKSELVYLNDELSRQKLLSEENLGAKKVYNKAKSDYNKLQATISGLESKLSLFGINTSELNTSNFISELPIYAPISGYLTEININNGSYLERGEQALEISGSSGMHLELNVLEKDASFVNKGQKVEFSIPSNLNESYSSEVELVENMVNESGYVAVHGELDRNSKRLKPGMYVQAKIFVDAATKKALPSEAIVSMDNKEYVLIQTNNKNEFIPKEVKRLQTENGYSVFEAVDEIPEGSIYLVRGSYFLMVGE